MGIFGMNTGQVRTEGGNITNEAEAFGRSKKKIVEIVDRILASDFTSDDAQAIAGEIKSHEPMLNEIQARLEAHGNFGVYAAKQTVLTNEYIKDSVK